MKEQTLNSVLIGSAGLKNFSFLVALALALLLTVTLSFAPEASARSNETELQRLSLAYKKLRARPLNPAYKAEYFDAFPQNSKQFKRLFESNGFAGKEATQNYLFQLEYLLDNHSNAVLERLISLAAQLKLDSAAAQTAQLILIKIALNYSKQFAAQFSSLASGKQKAVAHFMTEGKKGPPSGVSSLVALLRRTNHTAVANRLEAAL